MEGTADMKRPGGRPRVNVDREEIRHLRAQDMKWREIGNVLGIGASTAFYLWRDGMTPRTRLKPVQKPRDEDLSG